VRIIRYPVIKGEVAAIADGTATIELGPFGESGTWLMIERISLSVPADPSTSFVLYENSIDISNILDRTPDASAGIADEASPIRTDASNHLWAVWAGVTAGKLCALRIQARIEDPNETPPGSPGAGHGVHPAGQGTGWG
jgi:hypothetical protein